MDVIKFEIHIKCVRLMWIWLSIMKSPDFSNTRYIHSIYFTAKNIGFPLPRDSDTVLEFIFYTSCNGGINRNDSWRTKPMSRSRKIHEKNVRKVVNVPPCLASGGEFQTLSKLLDYSWLKENIGNEIFCHPSALRVYVTRFNRSLKSICMLHIYSKLIIFLI